MMTSPDVQLIAHRFACAETITYMNIISFPDLCSDPDAITALKKKTPVLVQFATDAGHIQTREGVVHYRAGDALATGVGGESWPIPRDRFLDTYVPTPPTKIGEDGVYVKKPIPIRAKKITENHFAIPIHSGNNIIEGNQGDWLVQYGPGSFGIVGKDIFRQTYNIVVTVEPR